MSSKHVFLVVGALAIGLCPMAKADDCTNKYFSTPTAPATLEVTTSSPVVIEKTTESPVMIEKTISTPVVIEKTAPAPVVLEDRIIKQKHFFGLGIWPLFDVELL